MRTIRIIIKCLFGICLGITVPMSGQKFATYIHHLEEVNGQKIHPYGNPIQDDKGFLWIPTDDGLLRYDGYQLKRFLRSDQDTTSSIGENLRGLRMRSDGKLYVCSFYEGLNIFDPATGTFEDWIPNANDSISFLLRRIHSMTEDHAGAWWISGTGFHHWNPDRNRLRSYYPSEILNFRGKEAEVVDRVGEILIDSANEDVLWLSTSLGILRFQISKERLELYRAATDSEEGLVHTPPDFCMGNDGRLYLGTWYDGLHIFDTLSKRWEIKYVLGEKDRHGLNNQVYQIEHKSAEELWVVAPYRGLFTYRINSGTFHLVAPHKSLGGLPTGSNYQLKGEPLGLVQTDDGAIWLRRYPTGFDVIHPIQQQFGKLLTRTTVNEPFCCNDRRTLFLPSAGGELQALNLSSGKLTSYAKAAGIPRQGFFTGTCTSGDQLWLLGLDALYRAHGQSIDRVTAPPLDSLQKVRDMHDNSHAWCFFMDSAQHFWIPLKRRGILKMHYPTWKYQIYPMSSNAFGKDYPWSFPGDIIETETGAIWVAFQQGVCFTRDHGASWQQYSFTTPIKEKLEFRLISALQTDTEGRIWMGSKQNGLFYTYHDRPYPQQIHVLTENDGLASREVYDLELDGKGALWMLTGAGLSQMNTRDLTFRHFGSEYGLHGLRHLTLLPDGRMAISASGGIYLFHPDSVYQDTSHYTPVIRNFSVFGEQLKTEKSIAYVSEISLTHDQNFFSFEFAAPNYWAPEHVKYQYQLVGIDEDWVDAGTYYLANYTDISPGEYVFRVRSSDINGRWSEMATSMPLSIAPPWSQTWWAYTLYGFLVLGVLYWIYKYQRRKWRLQTQLQVEYERANRLKELDTFKSRFYTNITHEFRTPLTVINGLTEHITGNTDIRKTIRRNSRRLLTMVNQLLDLSKLESNHLSIEWQQGNIIPYLEYLTESCHSLAQDKHLNLSFFTRQDEIVMDYDEKIIEQIVVNLLSNAIKFTPQYGSVKVIAGRIERQGNPTLELVVRDTGSGIPGEKLPYIFDRFYQADDSSMRPGEGTGIGLALVRELLRLIDGHIEVQSAVDRGTTFTVYLPIHHHAAMMPSAHVQDGLQQVMEEFGRESATVPEIDGDKPLVLIIEDNVDVIDYMTRCLQGHYALLTARNGKKGIETAFEYIPDAIISDVMMPEMDGFKVCETLKEDRRTSHIPIILLTAKATQEDKVKGLTHGADAYLTKPFDQQELLIRLENLTAISARLRQNLKVPAAVEDSAVKRESEFLDEVARIIESHLDDESFDTRQLCRAVAMSRTQLHRKLKALTGQSTASYIRMIRLARAKSLLESTDLPVGDISTKVGFKDFSHFSRSFSKEYGTTPSEVRG